MQHLGSNNVEGVAESSVEVEMSWVEVDGAGWRWMELGARFSNTPFMLFCSTFYPISLFFIFEILSIMLEARKLDKAELEQSY